MEKDLFGEKWAIIDFDERICKSVVYEVSNYGRARRRNAGDDEYTFCTITITKKFPSISVREGKRKYRVRYIHRLMAETFLTKESDDQKFVIHLDFDPENNKIWNLAWVDIKQKSLHHKDNPALQNYRNKYAGAKLTETQVKLLKRKLLDPNRKTRYKILAKQFGVSDMQLTRIKRGENWGHITID